MSKTYSVRDWDEYYEYDNRARTFKFIRLPIKHDGLSFRRLMARDDGMEIFGAWCLIVEVAAKCPKRGVLVADDQPLTAEDIALKTGGRKERLQLSLEVLSSPQIGWLDIEISTDHRDLLPRLAGVATDPGLEYPKNTIENTCKKKNKKEKKNMSSSPDVEAVFDHWKVSTGHLKAILSPKRLKAIVSRLENFSVADLQKAIEGNKRSVWHQGGNDRGKVFDDIELICRDVEHVERFIDDFEGRRNGHRTRNTLLAEEFAGTKL